MKPTILIVDDDDEVLDSMAELLAENGFDVRCASNGESALAQLREDSHVSAILLDVQMPVMNGATFRGHQLADPAIAAVPLVLLSGRSDIGPLVAALQPDAWLSKPFTPEALLRTLERMR